MAQVPPPPDSEVLSDLYPGKSYSPYAGRTFPSEVFWGDTHLHTAMSFDAGSFGNRLGIAEAYQIARGEEITAGHFQLGGRLAVNKRALPAGERGRRHFRLIVKGCHQSKELTVMLDAFANCQHVLV